MFLFRMKPADVRCPTLAPGVHKVPKGGGGAAQAWPTMEDPREAHFISLAAKALLRLRGSVVENGGRFRWSCSTVCHRPFSVINEEAGSPWGGGVEETWSVFACRMSIIEGVLWCTVLISMDVFSSAHEARA